ncbi:MAG TPA: sulfurase [Methylophaga aminisulfidivorans]|uniref:MOSC domain-containing protein n=1 Tax=Methylophaga TaxID=40222 RepID=UPI001777852E|nr:MULTISPECIES: MOSC domain-containing protein [Methylophaga]HIC47569.1 sulfurase [Methylophaga sp.]HIM39884.1 sulfurase [Methylophaga aminisulfidivorans]
MIHTIFIAEHSLGKQVQVKKIDLITAKGIVGDRNFDRAQWPGQNITFIEIEEIEAFNNNYQQRIKLADTRRNIITQGIRLNDLVGKEFSIGNVRFKGVELCEPCATLGKLLGNDTLAAKDVVKAFVHKSGLRADVLTDGEIHTGMRFDVI